MEIVGDAKVDDVLSSRPEETMKIRPHVASYVDIITKAATVSLLDYWHKPERPDKPFMLATIAPKRSSQAQLLVIVDQYESTMQYTSAKDNKVAFSCST